MAGPLFPSFTGSVPLTLDGTFPGIELDGADSQALSPWDGVEKCQKLSLLPTNSNRPSQLLPTGGHSMGIQMDPGDLYFQASLGRLHNSVCRLHSLKDSIHSLKN